MTEKLPDYSRLTTQSMHDAHRAAQNAEWGKTVNVDVVLLTVAGHENIVTAKGDDNSRVAQVYRNALMGNPHDVAASVKVGDKTYVTDYASLTLYDDTGQSRAFPINKKRAKSVEQGTGSVVVLQDNPSGGRTVVKEVTGEKADIATGRIMRKAARELGNRTLEPPQQTRPSGNFGTYRVN